MGLFRVRKGQHDHHGKIYTEGQVVECDKDLTKIFRNKFEKVSEEAINGGKITVTPSPEPPKVPVKGKKEKEEKKAEKDVTRHYKEAVDEGLKVVQKGTFFFVYEEDDPTPLNEQGLAKKDVPAFLKKYLEG